MTVAACGTGELLATGGTPGSIPTLAWLPPGAPVGHTRAMRVVASLLERETEVGEVAQAVAAATSGAGRLMMIEGPAGIGKTRLLAATRELAVQAGMEVLRARGGNLEREFSYGMVRQLFEPVLARAEPA